MRIAIFADSLPPSTDGVARTYTRFAEYLEENNYNYQFFSPFKPGKDFIASEKVTYLPSIPLIFYPHYKIATASQKYIFESLNKFQPDIIHVSSPTPVALIAEEFAKQNNIPIIAAYHTDFISYFTYYGFNFAKRLGWQYLKWFYNKFDKIVAPSISTAQQLENKGFKNVNLWTRGVNTEIYKPVKNKTNPIPKLLFAGRLVREKDILELIDVCNILDKKNFKYEITFAGDGKLRTKLEKKLPKANITGFISQTEMARLYRTSDIFVFPSTTETFGNVVLEALSSGLPVVCSDGGAAKDLVIHEKTGYISKAHNTTEFAEYVVKLFNGSELSSLFSKAARDYSLGYSWSKIHEGLIDIYYNAISTKNKPIKNKEIILNVA